MPRRSSTRTRILDASLKLFSEKGIKETTMRDIASEVGITEGAIYRHFTSKDQIVRTLFAYCSEQFYQVLSEAYEKGENVRQRFLLVAQAFLRFSFNNPEAFRYINLFHYFRGEEVTEYTHLPKDIVLKVLDEAIGEGLIKVRREYALAVFVGTLERIFLLVVSGIIEKEEGMEEEISQLLWRALTSL
ncbi:transcriptional regulator, TetR family [Thermocrinis albus DSM 14484]|uniref:Transcriptional regulator, TetR family n=1 Tax=Thermocrinis albus (strain DSM 14484 / JCM 11386 / HI 11/12) TaxID=638303 RepID=D3SL87_THEAH|nr:TetR/AcrR family transcriptional regulator [Thermocrinis albus]ADC89517.1 transcriptional regulator, TetR family [Thermocrinis albus DSM 14484]